MGIPLGPRRPPSNTSPGTPGRGSRGRSSFGRTIRRSCLANVRWARVGRSTRFGSVVTWPRAARVILPHPGWFRVPLRLGLFCAWEVAADHRVVAAMHRIEAGFRGTKRTV